MRWYLFLISAIVIICLRFYNLGITPYGLNVDEASYGYDAYSILKSGKDQWGKTLPLSLLSFGDDKPAGLAYAMIPFISFFDLGTLATRLPAALAGLILIWLLYAILQYLRPSKWNIFLSVIFSIMPWAYGISRLFYEPNIALVFFMFGWLQLLYYQDKTNNKHLYFAAASFAISGYFYVAYRLISVIMLAYALISKSSTISRPRWLMLAVTAFGIFGILSLPLVPSVLHGGGSTRLKQELFLRTTDHQMYIDDNRAMCYLASDKNPILTKLCYLIWNKPVVKLARMGEAIITNFSPHYLFQNSYQFDIIPTGYGVYLSVLAPFYLLGLVLLIHSITRKEKNWQQNLFIILSFLIFQLPGVIIEQPMVHRNLAAIFMVAVFIGLGWHYFINYVNTLRFSWVTYLIKLSFVAVIIFQGISYLAYYHSVYVNTLPSVWRYGIDNLFQYVQTHESDYEAIIFDGFEDPVLYYAFYARVNPLDFQVHAIMNKPNQQGWMHYASYKKFIATNTGIKAALCAYEKNPSNTLYLSPPETEFSKYRTYFVSDKTQVHVLYEAYDLAKLIAEYHRDNPKHLTFCKSSQ